jgi:hypothetical protein
MIKCKIRKLLNHDEACNVFNTYSQCQGKVLAQAEIFMLPGRRFYKEEGTIFFFRVGRRMGFFVFKKKLPNMFSSSSQGVLAKFLITPHFYPVCFG